MLKGSHVAAIPGREKSGSLSTTFSGCRSQDPVNVKPPQVAQPRSNVDRSTNVEGKPHSGKPEA